ncbi:NUDIX domain-containing protein [Candidatus Pacearchaeota archaeon]|nr:NUDIX domain-containing protein [Candidatus Pacearchaeota archaeon]
MEKNKIWKICICGVIKKGDKYLIVKRKSDDLNKAGFWEFPSGKVDFGESLNEALSRELLEEIGNSFSEKETKLIGTSEYTIEKEDNVRYTVQINYLIEIDETPEIKLSEEHVAFEWVDKEDERLDDFLKEIIKNIE